MWGCLIPKNLSSHAVRKKEETFSGGNKICAAKAIGIRQLFSLPFSSISPACIMKSTTNMKSHKSYIIHDKVIQYFDIFIDHCEQ